MKRITRKVTFHLYDFGTLDVDKGTVSVTDTVKTLEAMTKRQIFDYTQKNDCVLVRERITEEAFTMSTAYFVTCAKEYARQHPKKADDHQTTIQ